MNRWNEPCVVYFQSEILGLSEIAANPFMGMAAFIFPGLKQPGDEEMKERWK